MQDGVDDEDPDQQHQAEVEQETLGDGFVHDRYLFLLKIDK